MRATVTPDYGPAEQTLRYVTDHPEPPAPGAGEVKIRVHAASANPIDYKLRSGNLSSIMPIVLGIDLSGTVVAVGANVSDFKVGDEVFGRSALLARGCHGSYAEIALAKASSLAPKPPGLPFEEAAALPITSLTALAGLTSYGRLKSGEKVLIFGASGGVGCMAVQVAKALGAGEIVAICSSRNAELVRSLGATKVIDYTVTSPSAAVDEVRPDVVLDCVGGREIWDACARLPSTSRFVTATGDVTEERMSGSKLVSFAGSLAWRKLKSAVRRGPEYYFISNIDLNLREISSLFEQGKIRVVVEKVLPLDQVVEVHKMLESHRTRGKLIIKVAE